MKKHHSVIVIGGGPAGSAAAYTLSKHDIDVCIIDKAVFPRNKLCGGLLTLRSKKIFSQIFDAPWNQAFEYKASGVKFFFKNELLNSVEDYSELFFTSRIEFDNYLLKLAESKGGALYLGNGVAFIDLNNKVCRLRSGEEITYDYLVGADGVNSLVAKTIYGKSFDNRTIAFALEIEVDKNACKRVATVPEIYFGVASWGYGWVFPKKNTLTVGIGGIHVKNPKIKEEFTAFLIDVFGKVPSGKIKGHHIPFGDYRKIPGVNSALLVGDAAGLVEPITGEGIAFAMQSGYFAALAIVESVNSDQKVNVLESYQEKYSEIASALDHANLLKYLIFPKLSEYLFIKMLPKTRQLPLKHMDLMADNIKYEEYVKYLIAKVIKGVAKRMFFIK